MVKRAEEEILHTTVKVQSFGKGGLHLLLLWLEVTSFFFNCFHALFKNFYLERYESVLSHIHVK